MLTHFTCAQSDSLMLSAQTQVSYLYLQDRECKHESLPYLLQRSA